MPMMGNLGPLFAGLLGRGAGSAPAMSPRPMMPTMGSQIAGMFGGGRPSPMGSMAGNLLGGGGQPAGSGRAVGTLMGGMGGMVRPFNGPMANSAGPTLPSQAKAFGARRRFA